MPRFGELGAAVDWDGKPWPLTCRVSSEQPLLGGWKVLLGSWWWWALREVSSEAGIKRGGVEHPGRKAWGEGWGAGT